MHSAAFASCLGLIGAQKAQRDKAKELYRLLGLLNTTELPPAIYLYQGRLAQMYRSRQTNHVPRVWVHSQVVVDVTVAEKTRDGRYKHAGYRLFRKRGIRIRDDLKIEDVYNLLELEALPDLLDNRHKAQFRIEDSAMSRFRIASIEVLTGPMFSGKTEELIQRVAEARADGHKVQVFYPKMDTRHQEDAKPSRLQSHGGMTQEAVPVESPQEILALLEEDTSIVAIDEIQFFDTSLLGVCNIMADQGRRVMVAGLDRDFRGEPFETVAHMITRIKVDRLRARCAICDMPADFSQRIIDGNPAPFDSPLIMIGGPELYEPRCEEHYSVPDPPEELGDIAQRTGATVSEQLPGIVDVSHRLVRWIDRLQAIARTGIGYALDDDRPERYYDQERYEELLKLAAEMQAFALNQEARLDQVLSERFYTDWRAQVQPGQRGYATPKITTSGAVFNDQGEILLARRRDSPYWDLPTGWCEVGLSAAKNAVKEIMEETGLQTSPLQLVGIYDSQRWGFLSQTHLYALVFYCRIDGGDLMAHPVEIAQVGFFAEERLPLLFPGVKLSIEHSFATSRGERQEVYFDFVDSRTKQRNIC